MFEVLGVRFDHEGLSTVPVTRFTQDAGACAIERGEVTTNATLCAFSYQKLYQAVIIAYPPRANP